MPFNAGPLIVETMTYEVKDLRIQVYPSANNDISDERSVSNGSRTKPTARKPRTYYIHFLYDFLYFVRMTSVPV